VAPPSPAPPASPAPPTTPAPQTNTPGSGPVAAGPHSDALRLQLAGTIRGGLTPKSVVASQTGLFFVQNMLYLHTIRVFDRSMHAVKTISDKITLADFGYPQYTKPLRGSPVEAAFTPDGRTVFVSQYAMFGAGFKHPGFDGCQPGDAIDRSFVYRIDVATRAITGAVEVGSTPKFLAVTPDGRTLLVSNWCSGNVSVVDVATLTEITRMHVGWHPRGIAFDLRSKVAWIAVWDMNAIARIDLATRRITYIRKVGISPRHLVMDPAGRWLYVSLDNSNAIAKIDPVTGHVVAQVHTGREPRSMTIAADGRSLYVVNYTSGTASKVRTSDMRVIQTVKTDHHPIGITYDVATRQVWIACYSGTLRVYQDR
jgi:YVTN family beta-propeller protein